MEFWRWTGYFDGLSAMRGCALRSYSLRLHLGDGELRNHRSVTASDDKCPASVGPNTCLSESGASSRTCAFKKIIWYGSMWHEYVLATTGFWTVRSPGKPLSPGTRRSRGRGILDEFLDLCDAGDEAILKYARTGGVLELVAISLPAMSFHWPIVSAFPPPLCWQSRKRGTQGLRTTPPLSPVGAGASIQCRLLVTRVIS